MSTRTTYFGPRVSFRTTYSDPEADLIVHADSNTSLVVDGRLDLSGGGKYLSRVTTASATSLVLADGELAITSHATSAAVLAWRSGATTYTWSSTTAGVL